MSLLKFSHNGHNWGIVRNQKCASTSVLSYIAQVLWDADPNDLQAYNTFKVNAPGVYRKLHNFSEYELDLLGCNVRVAVWRDPVEKFVSGFYHTMFSPTGAQDALWQGPHTLDEFLENFDYLLLFSTVLDLFEVLDMSRKIRHVLFWVIVFFRPNLVGKNNNYWFEYFCKNLMSFA